MFFKNGLHLGDHGQQVILVTCSLFPLVWALPSAAPRAGGWPTAHCWATRCPDDLSDASLPVPVESLSAGPLGRDCQSSPPRTPNTCPPTGKIRAVCPVGEAPPAQSFRVVLVAPRSPGNAQVPMHSGALVVSRKGKTGAEGCRGRHRCGNLPQRSSAPAFC